MGETKYERLTWVLADAQDTVTHYNVTGQTDKVGVAKLKRDDARRNIEHELEAKDALNADLLNALENLENDDGAIPEHAWTMVQAALRKAQGKQ